MTYSFCWPNSLILRWAPCPLCRCYFSGFYECVCALARSAGHLQRMVSNPRCINLQEKKKTRLFVVAIWTSSSSFCFMPGVVWLLISVLLWALFMKRHIHKQCKDSGVSLSQSLETVVQTLRTGRRRFSHFAISGWGSQSCAQSPLKPERADLKRVFKHKANSTLTAGGGTRLFAVVTQSAFALLKARPGSVSLTCLWFCHPLKLESKSSLNCHINPQRTLKTRKWLWHHGLMCQSSHLK